MYFKPYRPMTEEHREKLREAHRKRRGLAKDECQLYGVILPKHFADKLRPWAIELAARIDYNAAHAFVMREWALMQMTIRGKKGTSE